MKEITKKFRRKKNKQKEETSLNKVQKEKKGEVDYILLIFLIALISIGAIMIFSSSYYVGIYNQKPYDMIISHLIFLLIGGIITYFLSSADLNKLNNKTFAYLVYGSSLILLLLLFYIGVEENNSVRAIPVGPVTIMPGEIAKLSLVFYLSWFLSQNKNIIKSFNAGVLPALFSAGIYVAAVGDQNMSTALTIAAIAGSMLIISGMKNRYLVFVSALGIVATVILLNLDGAAYRVGRIEDFFSGLLNPLEGAYQVKNSVMALGTGELFGLGLSNSIQKTLYLPEVSNDFILAIIGEEFGFLGILLLMAVCSIIVWRCIVIAIETNVLFYKLLVGGITSMFAIQIVFHAGVVSGLMPPTGVVFPLVSSGGNATLIFMTAFGVVLNVSRQNHKNKIKTQNI